MRDPTTNLTVKELTELAIERLSDRQLAKLLANIEQLRCDLLDAFIASDPNAAIDRISMELLETAIEHFSGRRLADMLAFIGEIRRDFRAAIECDPEVTAVLAPEKIAQSFSLDRQLRNIDQIFARVFKTAQ